MNYNTYSICPKPAYALYKNYHWTVQSIIQTWALINTSSQEDRHCLTGDFDVAAFVCDSMIV